ncbi:MAG: penicillin-binding protein beta-lactamase classC [Friedmanniella sp.]|nr:penicillin-binding protein beta-lactamase classC [Friedmanniella sp.]
MLSTTDHLLRYRLATHQRTGRAPSLVAGVVRDGGLVWTGGCGTVAGRAPTADTQYRIGSITKTFVAVAVLRLRDEGRLALTDTAESHHPGSGVGAATIAQLLNHTSGLTSEAPGAWWERVPGGPYAVLADDLAGEALRHTPGTRLHYSNVGFAVLGAIVARHRGRSCLSVIEQEILRPLELTSTSAAPRPGSARGWAVHPYADLLLPEPTEDAGAMAPAGQLWSTVGDLGRWARFLLGDVGEVLAPDTLTEMTVAGPVDDADTWTTGWGLGLQLRRSRGRRLVGHGGSMPGFVANVAVETETGTGVVSLANATTGPTLGVLGDDLLDVLAEHEPRLPAPWRPDEGLDVSLLELTGAWYWGPLLALCRLRPGGRLELVMPGGSRSGGFRADGPDRWVGLDGYYAGETMRVVRGGDGRVQHLDVATFVFTREPYDPAGGVPGGVDPAGWGVTP